jgi:hypothetical protein
LLAHLAPAAALATICVIDQKSCEQKNFLHVQNFVVFIFAQGMEHTKYKHHTKITHYVVYLEVKSFLLTLCYKWTDQHCTTILVLMIVRL